MNLFPLSFSIHVHQPIKGILNVFGIIATPYPMTKRNHVMNYCSRTIRGTQWYPVIGCQRMPKTRGTTTHCTASIKISKGLLPFLGSKGIGQCLFTSTTITGINSFRFWIFLTFFLFAFPFCSNDLKSIFSVVGTAIIQLLLLVCLIVHLFLRFNVSGILYIPIVFVLFQSFAVLLSILFATHNVTFPIALICLSFILSTTGVTTRVQTATRFMGHEVFRSSRKFLLALFAAFCGYTRGIHEGCLSSCGSTPGVRSTRGLFFPSIVTRMRGEYDAESI